jgi:hypothetical protein
MKPPPSLVIKPPPSLVIKFFTAKIRLIKTNSIKAEIDALESEVQQQRKQREKHIRRAVNPGR